MAKADMKSILYIFPVLLLAVLTKWNPVWVKNDTEMIVSQEPLFSFGIIADVQYCDCEPFNTRFYQNSMEKLAEALDQIAYHSPEFIINLGDLIDRDFVSFDRVIEMIEQSGIKTYHCLGNHDFSVASRDRRKVSRITGSDEGYYSFVHDQFRFIVLNGNEIATYAVTSSQRKEGERLLEKLLASEEPNAFDWNGGTGSKQMAWLKKELDESVAANEKVFLICHFPVFPSGAHNLLNSDEVLTLLKEYDNIISWFNGHNHDGGYGNFNMIHFVTFKGMIETENVNSFAVVEVYSNRLWIRGYGREKSQILAW
ncbi:MAG: metallophosphoesterase [Bacteroidales bacterium]